LDCGEGTETGLGITSTGAFGSTTSEDAVANQLLIAEAFSGQVLLLWPDWVQIEQGITYFDMSNSIKSLY
jgi:hypothetical protein